MSYGLLYICDSWKIFDGNEYCNFLDDYDFSYSEWITWNKQYLPLQIDDLKICWKGLHHQFQNLFEAEY